MKNSALQKKYCRRAAGANANKLSGHPHKTNTLLFEERIFINSTNCKKETTFF